MSEAAIAPSSLRGRRILVAEDEYLIAATVVDALAASGATVLGPVPRVGDGMALIAAEDWIDAALLDVNLNNQPVWPVVDALRARNVPIVLATGYGANMIPRNYADLPRCEKPVTEQYLLQALARALKAKA